MKELRVLLKTERGPPRTSRVERLLLQSLRALLIVANLSMLDMAGSLAMAPFRTVKSR